jgi:hypothetical protein
MGLAKLSRQFCDLTALMSGNSPDPIEYKSGEWATESTCALCSLPLQGQEPRFLSCSVHSPDTIPSDIFLLLLAVGVLGLITSFKDLLIQGFKIRQLV